MSHSNASGMHPSHAKGTTDLATLDLIELTKRVAALERAAGQKGNGACFCRASPAARWREGVRVVEDPRLARVHILLDHRCPHHGEKAQPALWGRHKEKELQVTWPQWDSLGIVYNPEDEATRKPFDIEAVRKAAGWTK
jgi:hypothetical protein